MDGKEVKRWIEAARHSKMTMEAAMMLYESETSLLRVLAYDRTGSRSSPPPSGEAETDAVMRRERLLAQLKGSWEASLEADNALLSAVMEIEDPTRKALLMLMLTPSASHTFEEIAERMNYNPDHARRIYTRAADDLAKIMGKSPCPAEHA